MTETQKHEFEVALTREIASALEPHIEANPDSTISNVETHSYSTLAKLTLRNGRRACLMVWLDPTDHKCEPNAIECPKCHGDGAGS